MATLKIKIVHQQHFIEGDRYFVYLSYPQLDSTIIVATNIKQEKYLDMCESVNGLKIRLELLGNKVLFEEVFEPDPCFDTYEEAMKHMENKGC